jgi:uncharacterized phage protein gp47/JayE
MIEIGHPFSRSFQDLIQSLETNLREGVEQPAELEIIFRKDTPSYEIKGPVVDASRVTGLRRKKFTVFERGVHWRYASGRLFWLTPPNGVSDADFYPDDNSRVLVEYTFRDLPSGITDFNAGSVTGTLVRAVARELKLLYEQMDQAYRRAFIDIAQGVALDNVVALLGIARHQAVAARGFVTFFLKKAPTARVTIPAKTRVADSQGRTFSVTEGGFIEPTLEESHVQEEGVIRTANRIGALTWVRVRGTTTDLATQPTAPGKPYGADERTITLAGGGPHPDGELVVFYKPKSVTVPVTAQEPGPDGNVGSGSIAVMPTPPRGVDGGVTNEQPLTLGESAETDEQLRERAKHRLEQAGNATLNAIKYSILTRVEGIEGVEVRDHGTDESIPLGEVRVRYSGGTHADVLAAIEESRAAGVMVRAEAIITTFISGPIYVIPDVGFTPTAQETLKREVVAALKKLAIGEAAYIRRFTALAYEVGGLADVAEAKLSFARRRPGESLPYETGQVGDPFAVSPSELIRPDETNLSVEALDGFKVTGTYSAAQHRTSLTIRLARADGVAVQFRSFKLNITVVLRARLKSTPDQPLQRICQVTGDIQLTSTDSVVFQVADADIKDGPGHPGFRLGADGHDPHVELQVTATAYPALKSGSAAVDLTGIT